MSDAEFLKRVLILVGVAVTPVLVWYLFDVILIAFGAIILATLLRLGAEPFVRWLSLPVSIALVLSGLLILTIVVGAGYLFGTRITNELQDVVQRTSSAAATLQTQLQDSEFGKFIATHIGGMTFSLTSILAGVLKVSSTVIEALIVVVISGVYLAAQPNLYRRGLIMLFPPRLHARTAARIDDIGTALRHWLIGQLIQMLIIGILSTLAVWMIGLPSAIALGLIAAAAEFIPYIGPIIAAIPATLVALTQSTEAALWTIFAYIIIHQVEGHLVVPLVQQHFVYIPPAVMLLSIIGITYLFGPVSIIFAVPIAVVVFEAVKTIYVHDSLGERID